MTDSPTTFAERHAVFFREVVALARQHKMDHLTLEFSDRFGVKLPENEAYNAYTGLRGKWSEGRHGDSGRISLEWRVQLGILETKP